MNACACNCGTEVKKTFAPGHDARVKGQVVRAAIAGQLINGQDPVEYAAQVFGPAGQAAVARGIARHRDGATPRLRLVPEPAAATGTVRAGRWDYQAEKHADGTVVYRNRGGVLFTAGPKVAATFKA